MDWARINPKWSQPFEETGERKAIENPHSKRTKPKPKPFSKRKSAHNTHRAARTITRAQALIAGTGGNTQPKKMAIFIGEEMYRDWQTQQPMETSKDRNPPPMTHYYVEEMEEEVNTHDVQMAEEAGLIKPPPKP
ncbi:hypothetical protein CRG98_042790 [Punica granatum]|uniref:Uncharacterized protein n=1 Tax=Punica granatum TaxID=22663 RepID=A0A2I0HYR9_PUNGR|nr:hypothetical protein CRG98_042790 [Punica granatum]